MTQFELTKSETDKYIPAQELGHNEWGRDINNNVYVKIYNGDVIVLYKDGGTNRLSLYEKRVVMVVRLTKVTISFQER